MALCLGLRVLRGPDWRCGDLDGGEGHLGTVTELLTNHRVRVTWDNGVEAVCRTGAEGKFDLRIYDLATVGVRHFNTKCICGEENIFGFLWRCKECPSCDLCSLCYSSDQHDVRHQFIRVDTPGSDGVAVKKRKLSVQIRVVGIFPGAIVTRGKDWRWGDQDGGPTSNGVVEGFENAFLDSRNNMVTVRWPTGITCSCRLGHLGCVDIKCEDAEAGPYYYRDHLPFLDTTKVPFAQTDAKASATLSSDSGIADEPSRLSERMLVLSTSGNCQETSNVFAPEANIRIGETILARSLTLPMSVVDKNNDSGESRNNFSESARVPEGNGKIKQESSVGMNVGDRVVIAVDDKRLRQLQEKFGGCTKGMLRLIGKTGEVTAVSARGSVTVKFGSSTYRFNPEALLKVPCLTEGAIVRILSDSERVKILTSAIGWKDEMSMALGKVGRVSKINSDGDSVVVNFGRQNFLFSPACCLDAPGAIVDSLDVTSGNASKAGAPLLNKYPEAIESLFQLRSKESVMGFSGQYGDSVLDHLWSAIDRCDHKTVRSLCEQNSSLVNAEHRNLTPLMRACCCKDQRVIDALLDNGADLSYIIPPHKTAVGAAMEAKWEDLAILLLERGADPFFLDHVSHTYLHLAAHFNMPRVVRMLSALGVDPNQKSDGRNAPLHRAIEMKRNEAVATLLSLDNIDLCIRDANGFTPLHIACTAGNVSAMRMILERDKSTVNVFHNQVVTPLHSAAINDLDECVRLLVINGGADINLQDSVGALYAPLHLACLKAKFRAAEALLELGADVQVKDARGDTPLHLCIGGKQVDDIESEAGKQECQVRVGLASMLISKGAYVDAKNNKGRDPLSYGVRPVREGVKQFIKFNEHFVRRQNTDQSDTSTTAQSVLQNLYSRNDLNEALKGVGLPCGVCGTSKSDVTLQPCQHKCVCSKCCDTVSSCPLCDAAVQDKVNTGPDEQSFDAEACKQM